MQLLVTGGAKRLGAAICLALAEKGYSVVVHYRHSQKEAEEVVKKCQERGVSAVSMAGDFSTVEGVLDFSKRYLAEFSETFGLINNVGNYFIGSSLHTPIDEWMDLFQLNLHAPFILSQVLAPSIIQQKGSIVNLGVSGIQKRGANTYTSGYSLAKEALWGFTRSFARELAPHHVQVNMVSPGMLDISVDLPTDFKKIPWGAPIDVSEVTRTIIFLLDPANHSITGQNIEVAGGLGLT